MPGWLTRLILIAALLTPFSLKSESLFVEEMTWTEVAQAIKAGKRSALVFAGSTEQNGPHMVLGKHNLVARHLAARIAHDLGDALIYPVVPFAPTGDPALHSGHMRFPGSVSLRAETYGEVIRDVAASAVSAGFRYVFIMADHGEGQAHLAEIAQELDRTLRPGGARVFFADAVYTQGVGEHAGREDTSMLLAVAGGKHGVRQGLIAQAKPETGAASNPQGASFQEGHRLLEVRIRAAVSQIRGLMEQARQER